MTLLRLLPALAIAALLSACGQPSEESEAAPPPEPAAAPAARDAAASAARLAVSLDPEGLRLVTDSGSTRLLHFERPTEEAMAVLTTVLGDPASRGVGYLLAEGTTPRRMRSFVLDDAHLHYLVRRAEELRGAGT